MDKEKINEIIDKKPSREEAKKLLNKEEFSEYEKLSEIKSILSEMHIEAPKTIEERVLNRVQKKRRHARLYFALIGAFSLLIVSLLILHSYKPLTSVPNRMKLTSPTSSSSNETVPGTDTSKRYIEIKTLAPQNIPTIKIKLNKKYSKEELFNALKKCGNVSSNTVEMNKDNFTQCVNTLKEYGIIQTDISSVKSKVQQKDNVKVKIEVIK